MMTTPNAPDGDPLRAFLEKDVAVAVVRTAFALRQAVAEALARIPPAITPAETGLLHLLHLQDGARVGELADLMTRDRTTVTRHADKLVGKGLVQRRVDPDDRRAVRLTLTARGRDLHAQVQPIRAALIETVTAHLDEDAKSDLVRTLLTLREQVLVATEELRCSNAS